MAKNLELIIVTFKKKFLFLNFTFLSYFFIQKSFVKSIKKRHINFITTQSWHPYCVKLTEDHV